MKPAKHIDAELFKKHFYADFETGFLYRVKSYNGFLKRYRKVGFINPSSGYFRVLFQGKKYRLNRVIYAMYHGQIDLYKAIDHINRVKTDNRICNLREVTYSENMQNLSVNKKHTPKRNKKTGKYGVSFRADRNYYEVSFNVNKTRHFVGCFKELNDAAIAYDREVLKLYGNQATLNFPITD